MKVKVESKKENDITVTLEGEDHSFPNLLRETVVEDEEVEFAAYNIDHPQLGHPKLTIVTSGKKKPVKILKEAIKKVRKSVSEFDGALDKVKEEKSSKTRKEPREKKKKQGVP